MPNNFPSRAPFGMLLGFVIGLLSIVPILGVSYSRQRSVQKFYFDEYVASYLSQTPIGAVAAFFRQSQGHLYYALIQNGHLVSSRGPAPGAAISVQVLRTTPPDQFHSWLRTNIYDGRDLFQLLATPFILWLIAVVFLLGLGSLLDFQRRKRARNGLKLRGPDLMTRAQFNHVTKGDGLTIYVKD
jgi:hypothetical protein